jgi:hypothetical protein
VNKGKGTSWITPLGMVTVLDEAKMVYGMKGLQTQAAYMPDGCAGWRICKIISVSEAENFGQAEADQFAAEAESKLKPRQ